MMGRGARRSAGTPLLAKRRSPGEVPRPWRRETTGLRFTCGAADGQAGAARAGPPDLGDGPVQLPLRLLHAEGGLRPRLRVPGPHRPADVRGDRAPGARFAAHWASRRSGSRAASRSSAATSRRSSSSSRGSTGLDLTLTTNGSLLSRKAEALKAAGLGRITVSLDSLDDEVFRAMNDVDFPVARVLEGIDAALAAGLAPVKVNVVVKRGLNEDGILPMARRFRGTGVVLRFIEYMDVGHTNGWRMDDVVPAAEIVAAIDAELPLEPVDAAYRGEVANRWRYRDGERRDRRHFVGDAALLRRLHPRPALGRRPGLHLPVRRPGARPAGAPARRRHRRRPDRRRSPTSGAPAPTATRSSAPPRPPTCPRSRCPSSAADERRRPLGARACS